MNIQLKQVNDVSPAIELLLKTLSNTIIKQKHPFVLLRDYQYFPKILGDDIDIATSSDSFLSICEAIQLFIEQENGIHSFITGQWIGCLQLRLIDNNSYDCNYKINLLLDIRSGYLLRGQNVFSYQHALANCIYCDWYQTLIPVFECYVLWLHITLKGRLKERYIHKVWELAHKPTVENVDIRLPYNAEFKLIIEACQCIPEYNSKKIQALMKRYYPKYRDKKLNSDLFSKLKRFFVGKLKNRRLVQPCSNIVLLGPDGVGKSTVGKLIEEKLLHYGVKTKYAHYALGTNPFVKKIMPEPSSLALFLSKGTLKPLFLLKGLRTIYYMYSYIKKEIRFIAKFIKYNKSYLSLLHNNDFMVKIIDRFPLNACINKKKLKYHNFLRYVISFLIKKPTAVCLLVAEPNIICGRKKELLPEQIDGLIKYERALIIKKDIPFFIVDATLSAEKVADKIIKMISKVAVRNFIENEFGKKYRGK